MTKLTAALAAACLALALTACTSPVDATPNTSEPSATASAGTPAVDRDPQGNLPTITFGADGVPTMTAVPDDPPTVISVKTLKSGDGATIGPNDFITVDYAGFLWTDGSEFDSSFGTGEPARSLISAVVDGWTYGLAGTRVGDRVLLVVPPEYGYGDLEDEAIPANSTLVFVVDLLDSQQVDTGALAQAEPTGAVLPTGLSIEGSPGAQPTLVFADDAPEPTELQTIVLAKGTGPEITENDTLLYHLTSSYWLDETNSTWSGPFEQAEAGGTEETIGQTVGTRLLLVYPADPENELPAEVVVLDLAATIPDL
ncbi:MAG: FKBP-type peptidyl-prolyl cis-trans isomerase [Propionicimonas sp.]